MALNIKDEKTERLAAEVATLAGQSKTAAIRTALSERRERLVQRVAPGGSVERLKRLLQNEIWPALPPGAGGRRTSRRERERILGYGPDGV